MAMAVSPNGVQQVLVQLGVFTQQAFIAANDERIAWTRDALLACKVFCDASKATTPGAVLWSQYLQHGMVPPLLTVVSPDDDDDGFAMPPKLLRHGDPRFWPDWVRALDRDPEVMP